MKFFFYLLSKNSGELLKCVDKLLEKYQFCGNYRINFYEVETNIRKIEEITGKLWNFRK